ncbi:hypothetical protein JXB01_02455 [Candidatus Micrarchaeota archaeon]|nr:hypothetical protein [Candidatus Micrarchaeota archaeon]
MQELVRSCKEDVDYTLKQTDPEARSKLTEEAKHVLIQCCPEWNDPKFDRAYIEMPFSEAVESYIQKAKNVLAENTEFAKLRAAVLLARAFEIGKCVFVPYQPDGTEWAQYTLQGRKILNGLLVLFRGILGNSDISEAELILRVLSLPIPGPSLPWLKQPFGPFFGQLIRGCGMSSPEERETRALLDAPWRDPAPVFAAIKECELNRNYEKAYELSSYWNQGESKTLTEGFQGQRVIQDDEKERLLVLWRGGVI